MHEDTQSREGGFGGRRERLSGSALHLELSEPFANTEVATTTEVWRRRDSSMTQVCSSSENVHFCSRNQAMARSDMSSPRARTI